jgi:hypothetical protein
MKLKRKIIFALTLLLVGLSINLISSSVVNATTSSSGKWVYQYTVDPYSFYRNSKTGKIRYIQTTSTVTHVINLVGSLGYGSSTSYLYYNPAYKHLLGA